MISTASYFFEGCKSRGKGGTLTNFIIPPNRVKLIKSRGKLRKYNKLTSDSKKRTF